MLQLIQVCLLDMLVLWYRILVFMLNLLRKQVFPETVTCRPYRVLFVSAFCLLFCFLAF